MSAVKQQIGQALDRLGDDLERLSHRIHENPELGYQETKAAAWLAEFLAAQGFKIERGVAGVPLKPNPPMAGLFEQNFQFIQFPVDLDDGQAGYGSTDCGNVSQRLPTIHPYIRISPDGVPGHSREFANWARSPMARVGMVAGAKALALTALDLLASPAALAEAKHAFAQGDSKP